MPWTCATHGLIPPEAVTRLTHDSPHGTERHLDCGQPADLLRFPSIADQHRLQPLPDWIDQQAADQPDPFGLRTTREDPR